MYLAFIHPVSLTVHVVVQRHLRKQEMHIRIMLGPNVFTLGKNPSTLEPSRLKNILQALKLRFYTGENIVILPNFLVWTFCGKAELPQNHAEISPFHKISAPGN